jgi:hypothetical protein
VSSSLRCATFWLAAPLAGCGVSHYAPEHDPADQLRLEEAFLVGRSPSSASMVRVQVTDDPGNRVFRPGWRNTVDINAAVRVVFRDVTADDELRERFKARAVPVSPEGEYSYDVVMQARHTKVGGKAQRVHVANYDLLDTHALVPLKDTIREPQPSGTQDDENTEHLLGELNRSEQPKVMTVDSHADVAPQPLGKDRVSLRTIKARIEELQTAGELDPGGKPVKVTVKTAEPAGVEPLAVSIELANAQPAAILPGRVNLRELGAGDGDELVIEVNVERKLNDNGAEIVFHATYHFDIIRARLHPEFAANLIFARADHGPDQAWAGNFAATVDWRWKLQDTNWLGDVINWFEPGFGFHVASLDQQENDVLEIGIGPNVSLWGGLLQGGLGYNLNADRDHLYYFIGTDLFKLLQSTGRTLNGQ